MYGIIGDWFINKDIGITHAWHVLEIVQYCAQLNMHL